MSVCLFCMFVFLSDCLRWSLTHPAKMGISPISVISRYTRNPRRMWLRQSCNTLHCKLFSILLNSIALYKFFAAIRCFPDGRFVVRVWLDIFVQRRAKRAALNSDQSLRSEWTSGPRRLWTWLLQRNIRRVRTNHGDMRRPVRRQHPLLAPGDHVTGSCLPLGHIASCRLSYTLLKTTFLIRIPRMRCDL